MKKSIFFIVLLAAGFTGNAQGISNFFSQKQADIKYMLQQVAALQVYIGYAEKGYTIAQQGLTYIGDIKKGEFDLHSAFFSSLSTVSPSVKNDMRVAEIISYQVSIISSFKKILSLKSMSPEEVSYLKKVYDNMSDACTKSLTDLINIITDNTYQMKDNERLARIDAIYHDTKDKYAFTQSFTSEAGLLAAQRQNELYDTQLLKSLQ